MNELSKRSRRTLPPEYARAADMLPLLEGGINSRPRGGAGGPAAGMAAWRLPRPWRVGRLIIGGRVVERFLPARCWRQLAGESLARIWLV